MRMYIQKLIELMQTASCHWKSKKALNSSLSIKILFYFYIIIERTITSRFFVQAIVAFFHRSIRTNKCIFFRNLLNLRRTRIGLNCNLWATLIEWRNHHNNLFTAQVGRWVDFEEILLRQDLLDHRASIDQPGYFCGGPIYLDFYSPPYSGHRSIHCARTDSVSIVLRVVV